MKQKTIVIAIDSGNKNHKTIREIYNTGLVESESAPFGDESYIKLNDTFYYPSLKTRLPYQRNKTTDDKFFILALIGIGKELEFIANNTNTSLNTEEVLEITLLNGLPVKHYQALKETFRKYFLNRGVINFEFNHVSYKINITDVHIFVQGYAAALTVRENIKKQNKLVVIDIGGYTMDTYQSINGKIDFETCDSIEMGIIPMYNKIISEVNAVYDVKLTEFDIDQILKEQQINYPSTVKEIVKHISNEYARSILLSFRERNIDLRYSYVLLVGGGSILLMQSLTNTGLLDHYLFVTDPKANARGYKLWFLANEKAKQLK